jgi:ribosomal-protein-alanine N-acetyltransferase
VLEKVGFQQEGRRRDHAFVNGEYVDLLEYGLLAEEWRA